MMEPDANIDLMETELEYDEIMDIDDIDNIDNMDDMDDMDDMDEIIVDDVTLATLSAIELITGNQVLNASIAQLGELVALIEADMVGLSSQKEKREQLLYLFYQQLGFSGAWRKWLELDSIMLNKVIETRNGVPISLGTLFIHFADYFNVEVKGILFPGQFVLRFSDEQGLTYVDPTDGKILNRHNLEVLLRGIEGNHALLRDTDLVEASNEEHYLRILQVLKTALIRDEHFSYALRCIDLILELEPDEPYEIRDRGFLLQQLDCNKLASEDFSYFIEQCPDDPITRILKAQVDELSATVDIIH